MNDPIQIFVEYDTALCRSPPLGHKTIAHEPDLSRALLAHNLCAHKIFVSLVIHSARSSFPTRLPSAGSVRCNNVEALSLPFAQHSQLLQRYYEGTR